MVTLLARADRKTAAWPGGVRAADHGDVLVRARLRLDQRRAVVDPAARQRLDARRVEAPVGHARGDQHGVAGELGAAREPDDALRPARLERLHLPHGEQLGPEAARLVVRAAGEVGARQAVREAEVVLDPRALPGLAARRGALDEHGPQPLRGAVDRGGEPGRAAADDHEVVEVEHGARGEAEPVGELERGRALEHLRRRAGRRPAAGPASTPATSSRRWRAPGRGRRRATRTGRGCGPAGRARRARRARSGGRRCAPAGRRRRRRPASRRAGRRASGRAAPPAGATASAGSSRCRRG